MFLASLTSSDILTICGILISLPTLAITILTWKNSKRNLRIIVCNSKKRTVQNFSSDYFTDLDLLVENKTNSTIQIFKFVGDVCGVKSFGRLKVIQSIPIDVLPKEKQVVLISFPHNYPVNNAESFLSKVEVFTSKGVICLTGKQLNPPPLAK